MDEQRVTAKHLDIDKAPDELLLAHGYWKSIKPSGKIGPTWEQFDLMALPTHVLPYALVVDFEDANNTFRYRFWGSRLTGVFGADFTGKSFDQLPSALRSASIDSYGHVVRSKVPQFYQFDIFEPDQTMIFQYAIRLPLSKNGETVSQIVSVLSIPISYNEHRNIAKQFNFSITPE
jgi:hypothetical protein